MTTSISIRLDQEDKEKAQKILEDLGLDLSTGIRVFLKAVVHHRGIPFEITESDEHREGVTLIRR